MRLGEGSFHVWVLLLSLVSYPDQLSAHRNHTVAIDAILEKLRVIEQRLEAVLSQRSQQEALDKATKEAEQRFKDSLENPKTPEELEKYDECLASKYCGRDSFRALARVNRRRDSALPLYYDASSGSNPYSGCSCEQRCGLYGHCCEDRYDARFFSVVDPLFVSCRHGYFMINKCPVPAQGKSTTARDALMERLCEEGNTLIVPETTEEEIHDLIRKTQMGEEARDIAKEDHVNTVSIPVTSNVTSKTYVNIYCGICHGENPINLISWEREHRCTLKEEPLLSPEAKHPIVSVDDLNYKGSFGSSSRKHSGRIFDVVPTHLDDTEEAVSGRHPQHGGDTEGDPSSAHQLPPGVASFPPIYGGDPREDREVLPSLFPVPGEDGRPSIPDVSFPQIPDDPSSAHQLPPGVASFPPIYDPSSAHQLPTGVASFPPIYGGDPREDREVLPSLFPVPGEDGQFRLPLLPPLHEPPPVPVEDSPSEEAPSIVSPSIDSPPPQTFPPFPFHIPLPPAGVGLPSTTGSFPEAPARSEVSAESWLPDRGSNVSEVSWPLSPGSSVSAESLPSAPGSDGTAESLTQVPGSVSKPAETALEQFLRLHGPGPLHFPVVVSSPTLSPGGGHPVNVPESALPSVSRDTGPPIPEGYASSNVPMSAVLDAERRSLPRLLPPAPKLTPPPGLNSTQYTCKESVWVPPQPEVLVRCQRHIINTCSRKFMDRKDPADKDIIDTCFEGPAHHVIGWYGTYKNRACAGCNEYTGPLSCILEPPRTVGHFPPIGPGVTTFSVFVKTTSRVNCFLKSGEVDCSMDLVDRQVCNSEEFYNRTTLTCQSVCPPWQKYKNYECMDLFKSASECVFVGTDQFSKAYVQGDAAYTYSVGVLRLPTNKTGDLCYPCSMRLIENITEIRSTALKEVVSYDGSEGFLFGGPTRSFICEYSPILPPALDSPTLYVPALLMPITSTTTGTAPDNTTMAAAIPGHASSGAVLGNRKCQLTAVPNMTIAEYTDKTVKIRQNWDVMTYTYPLYHRRNGDHIICYTSGHETVPQCDFVPEPLAKGWSPQTVHIAAENGAHRLYFKPYFIETKSGEYLVCKPVHQTWIEKYEGIINLTFLVLSEMCLFLVIAVYTFVSSLRNGTGLIIINNCVAFFLAFIFFGCSTIAIRNPPSCLPVAVLAHYFMLAAFTLGMFYAVEIVRGVTSTQSARSGGKRKAVIFCVLGWSLPALLVGCFNLVSELLPGTSGLYDLSAVCFLHPESLIYFLYVPLICIITANFAILTYIIVHLIKSYMRVRGLNGMNRDREQTVTILTVTVKLMVSFGSLWILAIIAVFTQSRLAVYLFSLVVSLQGVIYFIVFVGNARVIMKVKHALPCFETSNGKLKAKKPSAKPSNGKPSNRKPRDGNSQPADDMQIITDKTLPTSVYSRSESKSDDT